MSEKKVVSLEEYRYKKALEGEEKKKKEAQQRIHESLVRHGFIEPEDEEEE